MSMLQYQDPQWTPLHVAAKDGDLETVVSLMEQVGAEHSSRDSRGASPLHLAALNGHKPVVKTLVAAGADVSLQNARQATPLHFAALNGHVEAVETLLQLGADVSCRTDRLSSPLHLAAFGGHAEALNALLNAGSDTASQDARLWTALHVAAQHGHTKAIETLIKAGANVSCPDGSGTTPSHVAAHHCHPETLEVLLGAGADVSPQDKDGWSPLHLAVAAGDESTVETLLKWGADLSSQNSRQQTPAHLTALSGDSVMLERLLQGGADVSCRDTDGWTPLHHAVRNGFMDTVAVLLKWGAAAKSHPLAAQYRQQFGDDALAVVGETTNDLSPLDVAVIDGKRDVVKLLLPSYTGHQLADGCRRVSTFDWAVMRNEVEILAMLVEHVPSRLLTVPNGDGWTPLQVAVYHNSRKAVEVLVKSLVSTQFDSGGGSTPEATARRWNSKAVALIMGRSEKMMEELQKVEEGEDAVSAQSINEWLDATWCGQQLEDSLVDAFHTGTYLGAGGFGVVYGVTLPNRSSYVLKSGKRENDDMSLPFEAAILKSLHHPHIVQVFGIMEKPEPLQDDTGDRLKQNNLGSGWGDGFMSTSSLSSSSSPSHRKSHGAKCMVMEWMNQGSLIDWMQQNTAPISEETVRMLMNQALEALAYLHQPVHTDPFGRKNMALVHHDIKPHNMLIHVGDDGVPVLKLADFGLSHYEINHANIHHMSVGGTRAYLGPESRPTEVQPGTVQYTPASDIYSWAKTFLEVAAQRVFKLSEPTPAVIDTFFSHINISSQAEDLLRKCFDEDPEQRPEACNLLGATYFKERQSFPPDSPTATRNHHESTVHVVDIDDISTSFAEIVSEKERRSLLLQSTTRCRQYTTNVLTSSEQFGSFPSHVELEAVVLSNPHA